MWKSIEVETLDLIPILDKKLIELLAELSEEEWEAQTTARLWKVKDVASHLLDGNLRGLSMSRDGYFGTKAEKLDSYHDLVDFINSMNMSWTTAARRLSPQILIKLLESSGEEYYQHLKILDPFEKAIFPVAWAHHQSSPNWFHIAREYSEKFLHQQQIRDALDNKEIMIKELFYPFIDILMYAFPCAFSDVDAARGTVVSIEISTEIGGIWSIVKSDNGWSLKKNIEVTPDASLVILPDIAWRLFSKSVIPKDMLDSIVIKGDRDLAMQAMKIISFMV